MSDAGEKERAGVSDNEAYSDFERGERQALLQVRSFVIKHGPKEVDAFCAQRLHDIRMDARHAACAPPTPSSCSQNNKSRNSDLEKVGIQTDAKHKKAANPLGLAANSGCGDRI